MTAVRLREGVPQGVSAVVVNEPGSYDGTAIDIDPFAEGQTFGGFQSDPGQGASRPIFVTFKAPLSDTLSVTILDPDFDVNSAKAGFVDGHHETQNFLGDNNPGAFKSSTITFGPGVSSLLLTPASNDYVAYSLVYGPTGHRARLFRNRNDSDPWRIYFMQRGKKRRCRRLGRNRLVLHECESRSQHCEVVQSHLGHVGRRNRHRRDH